MIPNWLDATEAIGFARGIVRDINALYGVDSRKKQAAATKSDAKMLKKLDGIVRRTRAFAQEHKLNVYKKGKFLNTVKWELREAGYEDALIDDIVALLTPAVA